MIADSTRLRCAEPQGAFYIWARLNRPPLDTWQLADQVLEQVGVALTPGDVFGPSRDGDIRLSFSLSLERIEKGMRCLNHALEDLRNKRDV